MKDEALFSPDPRTRWAAAMQYAQEKGNELDREIVDRYKSWPKYWWGTANAWLVFLGPSPGNSGGNAIDWNRERLPTLGKPHEHFKTQWDSRGFWDRLREWTIQAYKLAGVFPDDEEAALGLTLLANVLSQKAGKEKGIPEEALVEAMPTVVTQLELVRPRIVVSLTERIFELVYREFQKRYKVAPPRKSTLVKTTTRKKGKKVEFQPKYFHIKTNFGLLLIARAPIHPSHQGKYNTGEFDKYLADHIRSVIREDGGEYVIDSTSLQSEPTSHISRPDRKKESTVSNRKVSVDIYVGGQRPENKVGSVVVTEEQVRAAFAEWNSRLYLPARQRWIRNKRDSKAVYDDEGKCYPPKKIMRIATREAVRELMGTIQKDAIRHEIARGLGTLEGGYQVLETYSGCRELGFRVRGGLNPDGKSKCG